MFVTWLKPGLNESNQSTRETKLRETNRMALVFGIFGVLLIIGILWDVFETIVLPRRVTRRIRPTRLFYRFTWQPWRLLAAAIRSKKRREIFLGIYGPLSLLALLTFWALSVIAGFALLHWAIKSHIGSIDHASSLFI